MPPTPRSPSPRMRSPSVTTITRTSGVGAVRQHRVERVALRVGEVQAARPAVDVAVVLAGDADDRGVDDRQHLGDVLVHQAVEERLVAVLQAGQVDVALLCRRLLLVVLVGPRQLLLDRGDVRGRSPSRPNSSRSASVKALPLFNIGHSSTR